MNTHYREPTPAHTGHPALVALIGPPGAGKTTWRHAHQGTFTAVVSLDDNRARLSCCPANQAVTAAAVEMGAATAHAVLASGGVLLWDATNARRVARRILLAIAAQHSARTTAVVLLPDLGTALARNAGRDPQPCPQCGYARRVPDHAITAMHTRITADLPTLPDEGWHEVHHVDAGYPGVSA